MACSTAMQSNNVNISRLLDWFPCFNRRTEQCNRRQQTSLRRRCGIARLTIYFHNVSPVNAKFTSPYYVHQYTIFLSSSTYTVAIVTPTTVSVILPINRPIFPFPFSIQIQIYWRGSPRAKNHKIQNNKQN